MSEDEDEEDLDSSDEEPARVRRTTNGDAERVPSTANLHSHATGLKPRR